MSDSERVKALETLRELEMDIHQTFDSLQELCTDWFSRVQGFDRKNFDGDAMLVVTELAEAVEADRKNLPDVHVPTLSGREVEFADALVRIFHMGGKYNLDLSSAFVAKMEYNFTRPVKHGKNY